MAVSSEQLPIAKIQELLDAVVALSAGLDLESVLRRIVATAVELADCRYGALGVIGTDESLIDFHTIGIGDELRIEIGDLPHGEGILGLLIKHPTPLRLDDLRAHPDSYGFPANHPPMKSFLGVPIRVHGEIFGNLYLTEKSNGLFTESDERVVLALASAAGIAIENARLFAEAKQSQATQSASAAITTEVLSGADFDDVLISVAEYARVLTQAHSAFVAFLDAEQRVVVEVCSGPGAQRHVGTSLFAEIRDVDGITGPRSRHFAKLGLGAIEADGVVVALPTIPGAPAWLIVFDLPPQSKISQTMDNLELFANQAGVALELGASRQLAETVSLFEERDRIARDLHDFVIQRLFAAGMQLQGTTETLTNTETIAKVNSVIADLDRTIREIRSTIFDLQHTERGDSEELVVEIARMASEYAKECDWHLECDIDILKTARLNTSLELDVTAAIREMLSNAARHANASAVSLHAHLSDDELQISVQDNGIGVKADRRESGVGNLRSRASSHGGTFSLRNRTDAEGGTVAMWTALVSD